MRTPEPNGQVARFEPDATSRMPGDRAPILPRLILASGSPRRRELLTALGVAFTVRPPELDETPGAGESPADYVRRLAREKSEALASDGELVLAADTAVLIGDRLLNKPDGTEEARRMLRLIAGAEHTVLTAVGLWEPARRRSALALERSRVRMASMSDEEIDWYVGTGEPLDKAGAYAVQGLGALFVETVEGNPTTVVGLPVPATYRLFRQLGYDLRAFRHSGR